MVAKILELVREVVGLKAALCGSKLDGESFSNSKACEKPERTCGRYLEVVCHCFPTCVFLADFATRSDRKIDQRVPEYYAEDSQKLVYVVLFRRCVSSL